MAFANGENVGAYRIVEKLGQGGMATVYKAYHPALDRYVAIKVMHPAFMEDPNFLARFQREARIVAKLDHPHIIPIYDFAEHNGNPYLVIRFIEGETLKARIERGPLESQDILRIAQAVGEALTYAHGHGVLHRDIKPSNILLTPEGSVYLTDFGLARMAEAGESTLSRDMMVGTPQYISPEQAKGIRKLDARTDVYSLGVVLYELLVGRTPFMADTPYAIVHDHIFTPLPMPRELKPDLPEPLERVLLKALAKEPDDRFQSVTELIAALESALEPSAEPKAKETAAVPPPSTIARQAKAPLSEAVKNPGEAKPKPQKKRWLWAVVAIAAIIGLGVSLCLGVRFLQKRAQRIREGTSAASLLEEAQTARENGEFERALELYEAAVQADPQMLPAYLEASTLLQEMGRDDQSLDTLMRGVEANPNAPDIHMAAAGTALLLKNMDTAQGEIEWMQQELPDHPLTHALTGILLLEQGHPCEEARPALEKALRAEPEQIWGHYGMGVCHAQEGSLDPAREELTFVLERGETPPLLRNRAEELLVRLEAPPPDTEKPDPGDEAILNEFDVLLNMAQDVEDEGLRQHLRGTLNEARQAWKDGDKERSINLVEGLIPWVEENTAALGPEKARMLTLSLNDILRRAR